MNSPRAPEQVIEALLDFIAFQEEQLALRQMAFRDVLKEAVRQGVDFGGMEKDMAAAHSVLKEAEAMLIAATGKAKEAQEANREMVNSLRAARTKGATAGTATNKDHAAKRQAWADENWPIALKEANGIKAKARVILHQKMEDWAKESKIKPWSLRTIQDKF